MCALAAGCGSVPDFLLREPVVKLFRALFSPSWSRFIRAPAGAGAVRSLLPGMLAMAGFVVLSKQRPPRRLAVGPISGLVRLPSVFFRRAFLGVLLRPVAVLSRIFSRVNPL